MKEFYLFLNKSMLIQKSNKTLSWKNKNLSQKDLYGLITKTACHQYTLSSFQQRKRDANSMRNSKMERNIPLTKGSSSSNKFYPPKKESSTET